MRWWKRHGASRSPVASALRCFMHVPKSAGSSVLEALRSALPEGAIAPQRHDDVNLSPFRDFDALHPELRAAIVTDEREVAALARHRVVSGHFTLPLLLRLAPASAIATIVREPRARLLSLYMYWAIQDLSAMLPYDAWKHASRPLGEFLAEPSIAPVMDNQLCRMLLHGDRRIPAGGFIAPADVEALAVDSLARLDELGFVGVQELPQGMWDGLSAVFGVPLAPQRVNVTEELHGTPRCPPLDESLDATSLSLLERCTAVDRILYRELVSRRGDEADPETLAAASFARQLAQLRTVLESAEATRAAPEAPVRHA